MSKLWISTGKSKREMQWKNQEISWMRFLARLQEPVRTKETFAEYLKLTKDQRAAIKDVGGFVGGTLTGARRKKGTCSARYLLTLDVDDAPSDFLEDLVMWYGDNEIAVYGTHGWSRDTRHYRVLMPLKDPLHADEYEAVARKVAGDVNIEVFDPTTFQPERLMYWPSVSADAEYFYWRHEGKWLNGQEILGTYVDWRDVSEWPMSEKSKRLIQAGVEKQEDPTEKGGHVGVFCRAYGVDEAIQKFLSHVYEPAGEDRYTYVEGSTAAGLIVYDNKFSFSHHATDPTSGRLCNAFDLVRIHLFGESDDRVDATTPHNKKPSYGKMIDLIMEDDKIKGQVVGEKSEKGREKLGRVVEEGADWQSLLDVDKKGNILNTIQNVVLVLENDEDLREKLTYDEMQKAAMVRPVGGELPWRKITKFSQLYVDADDSGLRNYLELIYGITARDKIKDGLEIAIRKNAYHPVKQYLESCRWDGKERLERLFIDNLGAEDNVYVREVTRKAFVAAVARIYQPGIKFDTVLVLVGAQGIGKSRLIAMMGKEWFSDTMGNMQNKDAMENLHGVWIMELGELAGLKRAEIDTIKLFVARRFDRFRVSYAKRVEEFPRQCIFIGTTNESEFLHDQTGNRRFWPVQCGPKQGWVLTNEDVNQVWAEACHWYTMGEDLFLTDEVENMATVVQEQYTEQDDRTDEIRQYLDKPIPINWDKLNEYERRAYLAGEPDTTANEQTMQRDWVTVQDIWSDVIRGQIKDLAPYNTKFIRSIMNKMAGWKPKLINRKPYGTSRGWIRIGSSEDVAAIRVK
jgi:putative DNA primase/helicase